MTRTTTTRRTAKTIRLAGAELAIIDAYDLKRSLAGHDYGNGQRKSELARRRRELTDDARFYRAGLGLRAGEQALELSENHGYPELESFTADELANALDTSGMRSRLRRVQRETYRRATPATRRTAAILTDVIREVDALIARKRGEAEPPRRRIPVPSPLAGGSPELDASPAASVEDLGRAIAELEDEDLDAPLHVGTIARDAIAGAKARRAAAAAPPAPVILVTTSHPSLEQHPGQDGERIHPRLGRLVQPRHFSSIARTAAAGVPWAADNDCFQGLDRDKYVRMLDALEGLPGCLFVTVPDVVADAAATAELFAEWAPELERRGLPLGYVAQDGLTVEATPWARIACLFIGGSDDFKLGPEAAELAREAQARGVWVHWGRVNTRRRYDLIRATGAADSFDGSKWARWRKTYLPTALGWLEDAIAERRAALGVTR